MRLLALLFSLPTALLILTGGSGSDQPPERAIAAFDQSASYTEVTATAYTSGPESTGKSPGHPQYGITATGAPVRAGHTVAVDPREVPLGSRVCVVETGLCYVAEDTGGAISGNRIDLYMESVAEALRWGKRTVRIQVFPKV